jgi:iron complex transport system permease protein
MMHVTPSAIIPTITAQKARPALMLFVIGGFTLIFVYIMLERGSYPVTIVDLFRVLAGLPAADPQAAFVVYTFRLPRILTAWMIGAGLGLSGAMIQAVTHNPLADPGILGVNGGASVAAVAVIVFLPSASPLVVSMAAFAGAAVACLLLFSLVPHRRIAGLPLLLAGVAISALLTALMQILLLMNAALDLNRTMGYFQNIAWLVGGWTGQVTWKQFWVLAPWLAVLMPLSLFKARELNVLALGEEPAIGLGVPVQRQTVIFILLSAAICAACVATVGPLGFVGLIAPNMARSLLGSWQPRVLPASLMIGGLLMVSADLLARLIAPWWDIPCGMVVAALGGPFLLVAIMKRQLRQRVSQ